MKISDILTARKSAGWFEDGSSNWVILENDGSTFATAYYDKPSNLWQVFRKGGLSVGTGRTIEAAIYDVHDL